METTGLIPGASVNNEVPRPEFAPPMRALRKWLLSGGLVALLLIPLLCHWFDEPYLLSLFSRILIYALAAVSLDLILGFGGMVSLGHAAFFGAGAYVVGILAFHQQEGSPLFAWPVFVTGTIESWIAWPAAMVVSAVFGLIIGAICLRTTGIFFIMITLAFAQMLYFFSVSLETYGGDDGLSLWNRNSLAGLDLSNDTTFYLVCLTALIGFLFVAQRLVNSRFGMVLQGSRQNERRMQSLGYPTYRYKLLAFVIASSAAGLAGALIANHTEFVSPGLMHWTRSGEILVMVILGGMGTLYGPVLGAFTLLMMEEWLSSYTEHWAVFLGPFLVMAVLFARQGLFGLLESVFRKVFRGTPLDSR